MTTQLDAPSVDLDTVEAFATQVTLDRAAAANAVLVYLGDRLGLWQALASVPAATSAQLAERSGLAERQVREWMAAQAAAGYVTYDAESTAFTLPTEHALVLADEDSPASGIAGFEVVAAVWASVDRLAQAYTTGTGVGWHEHDGRLFSGIDRFYRTLYRNSLLTEWLPAIDGVVARLERGIRVLDVGCGLGTPTILMAEAFPASTFIGVDYHVESVRRANEAAEEAGVSDRVTFRVGDATSYDQSFDLIWFFDAVHDMGDPVGALAHARASLAPGGRVLAVEPYAEDRLEDNLANPAARVYYPGSATLCVPHSVSEGGQALGAQAGPARLLDAFRGAGFDSPRLAASTAYNLVIEAGA